jgi:ferredoxin--NADP+ reductase
MGRITRLIESGKFHADLGIAPLDPANDRVMICGSMAMLKDVKELVEGLGFCEGSLSHPAEFVVERAFVG